MERTTIDFGIDLGTTNSTIAVISGTDAKVIPNKAGSAITPSAVWIDKRGNVHVGQEAKLRAFVEDTENADVEFKLRMGRGEEGSKAFARSGRRMLPEELSAEVLKSLRMDVQTNLGEQVRAAVITVPAAFENPSTNATMRAAQLAGLSVSPLLLEPVAASLAYGFQSKGENLYWFTYDFGGGTFDAAVMRIRDGLIQVVNHDGDNFLGGKLIDWDIVTKKLLPALAEQGDFPDLRRGNKRWEAMLGKLKYHAELAKIEVCRTRAEQEIFAEGLGQDASGRTVDFAYKLTPVDVEEVSRPYIERSLVLCRKTLKRAGLAGKDLDRVLMVGGTTLIPWLRDAVAAELGARLEFGIDPVTVVARGAAIFASMQPLPRELWAPAPVGTWTVEIERPPVGNSRDPDVGGRVVPPGKEPVEGCTVEFVDRLTHWRSGRLRLGAGGAFMTTLYAEERQRHEFDIELCDPRGTRIPTSPSFVVYTLGVEAEDPPAAMSIGVGLADGRVASYIRKGTKLPARKSLDHYTTEPVRAGQADDVLRIPLLEGEQSRAERNHGIGVMTLTGAQVKRDLPAGSLVEITLSMDKSQQVRLHAMLPSLDEDFEMTFDSQMKHGSLEELRAEARREKERLDGVRKKVDGQRAPRAAAVVARLEGEQAVAQVDSLADAAGTDPDAVAQLDRRLKELASALDEAEDALQLPELLDKAETVRKEAETEVQSHGDAADRGRLAAIKKELQQAIDASDTEALRRCTDDLRSLNFDVCQKQPGWHVGMFSWLEGEASSMRDPAQASQIIAQGRRAMKNNDVDALKAANRQLLSMLPRDVQAGGRHANVGSTMTRG